jgi:2-C-methyl-D-erythritol 4-phosphate cytidylyltransferase
MSLTLPRCFGLIPAAGVGTRMQSSQPKQFLQVGEQTILQHSVAALLSNEKLAQVLVVTSAQDECSETILRSVLVSAKGRLLIAPCGGNSRAQSVLQGLQRLIQMGAGPLDWVLVHDAARPGLSQEALNRLITQVLETQCGAILAIPVVDTVKQVRIDQHGLVEATATLDRTLLWQAQTPQMFRIGQLTDALQHAAKTGFIGITDEASAIERVNGRVLLVQGERCNLKITVPEDLETLREHFNKSPISKDHLI